MPPCLILLQYRKHVLRLKGLHWIFPAYMVLITNGLKELIKFFSLLPHDKTKPELKGDDRFISSLEKAAEGANGTQEMWDMLFEYKRFCNDMDAFDELAIKFAMRFDISPPSW